MAISDEQRVYSAYDAIIKSLKTEIREINSTTYKIIEDMDELNAQITHLSSNSTDPKIAEKFKELLADPEVQYYFRVLQLLKSVPKCKNEQLGNNMQKK